MPMGRFKRIAVLHLIRSGDETAPAVKREAVED